MITTEQEINELEELLLAKTGKNLEVKYGELWALGTWFYVPRTQFDNFRLGTTFETAKSFIDILDVTLITFD